jgi:cytochrome c oxidase assembly protein subunit 15
MPDSNPRHNDRQVAIWLFVCAATVLAMILLGGVTRLTNSGLSMVEWKPLVGAIPPLSEASWLETFAKYKQFPEYQKINHGMSLDEFKSIFLFEYLHRLLGRLIGLLFLLPFLYFFFRRRLSRQLAPKLLLLFGMGAFQGLLGWYMVKSGLSDNPHVSQYRLTAHLGTAVAIYGYMVWLALGLVDNQRGSDTPVSTGLRRFSLVLSGLLFLMILSGGLVAGTHAGLAYSNWPLMGESFIPPGLYGTSPMWLAIFEDIATIQFNHRMFAYLLVVLVAWFALWALRSGVSARVRAGVLAMVALLCTQVTLGISTLLLLVPVPLAVAHQGVAICLFTSSLFVSHCMARRLVSRDAVPPLAAATS